jgi:hypothetical protein
VSSETKELLILRELPALELLLLRDDGRHLLEEQIPGYAAEEGEGPEAAR